MALHGDVSVNGNPVLYWSARRTSVEMKERNEYEVEVFTTDDPYNIERYKVMHTYSDGAASLAATVLRHYNYRKAGIE